MSSTSYGFAVNSRRSVVLTGAELFTVAILIIVVCWFVFPRDLSSVLRHSSRVDGVTLSYMRSWLAAKPDDYGLRLVLAEALISHGEFSGATRQLDLVEEANRPDYNAQLHWLRLSMDFTRLMAVPLPQRRKSTWWLASNKALGRVYVGELDMPKKVRYAEMLFALDQSDGAIAVYRALAGEDESKSWYVRIAEVYLSQGRYQDSASAYAEAMHTTSDFASRKRYFLSAIDVLAAGNLSRDALDLASTEERYFRNDSDVLFRLMELAEAAGDLSLAQYYASRLLRLAPREGEAQ